MKAISTSQVPLSRDFMTAGCGVGFIVYYATKRKTP